MLLRAFLLERGKKDELVREQRKEETNGRTACIASPSMSIAGRVSDTFPASGCCPPSGGVARWSSCVRLSQSRPGPGLDLSLDDAAVSSPPPPFGSHSHPRARLGGASA